MDEPLLPTTNTNQVDSITLNMKDQPPIYVIAPHFTATYLSRQAKSMVRRGSFEVLPSDLHLDKKLGEVQFGVVFKGTFNGKPCAVKMLKDGVTKGMEYERLLLELSILAGVGKHPNLVCFLGACFQEDKTPMIVEEFVEGPDLEEYLHFKQFEFNLGQPTVWSNFAFLHYPDPHLRIVFEYTDPGSPNPQPSFDAKISPPAPTLTPWTRCFAAPQVQLWALDILSALEHLHALDPVVIHRDLKPANILLTRDRPRRLKLADFGLAKRFSRAELRLPAGVSDSESSQPRSTRMTRIRAGLTAPRLLGRPVPHCLLRALAAGPDPSHFETLCPGRLTGTAVPSVPVRRGPGGPGADFRRRVLEAAAADSAAPGQLSWGRPAAEGPARGPDPGAE